MAAVKVDYKGRVRCYPAGRKGFWKRVVAKAFRNFGKKEIRDAQAAR